MNVWWMRSVAGSERGEIRTWYDTFYSQEIIKIMLENTENNLLSNKK